MTDYKKPAEDIRDDLFKYVGLKENELKLKAVKALSVTLSRVTTTIILLMVLNVFIMTLTIAFVLVIGELTGSYMTGALISVGFFLLILIYVWSRRKRLFSKGFVSLFMPVFFSDDEQ